MDIIATSLPPRIDRVFTAAAFIVHIQTLSPLFPQTCLLRPARDPSFGPRRILSPGLLCFITTTTTTAAFDRRSILAVTFPFIRLSQRGGRNGEGGSKANGKRIRDTRGTRKKRGRARAIRRHRPRAWPCCGSQERARALLRRERR